MEEQCQSAGVYSTEIQPSSFLTAEADCPVTRMSASALLQNLTGPDADTGTK